MEANIDTIKIEIKSIGSQIDKIERDVIAADSILRKSETEENFSKYFNLVRGRHQLYVRWSELKNIVASHRAAQLISTNYETYEPVTRPFYTSLNGDDQIELAYELRIVSHDAVTVIDIDTD